MGEDKVQRLRPYLVVDLSMLGCIGCIRCWDALDARMHGVHDYVVHDRTRSSTRPAAVLPCAATHLLATGLTRGMAVGWSIKEKPHELDQGGPTRRQRRWRWAAPGPRVPYHRTPVVPDLQATSVLGESPSPNQSCFRGRGSGPDGG